jgi:RelA/SpoT family (p)ppGpp synthetase
MMLAMTQDIRVILVKLADRLHNMRTLETLPPAKRRRKAIETLDIYAPIAARLGMNQFRLEFEDLGFSTLYPMRYRVLKEAMRRSHKHRKELLDTIEKTFQTELHKNTLPPRAIFGREKHVYSLYKKMRKKSRSFREVMDVYAFRILVDSQDTCYRTLGIIHHCYKPVLGRFKDYIAVPKANGYQALHTTLLGPHGVPIEVQIRTQDMEYVAENGIAAHWLYKGTEVAPQTHEWLQDLLELQEQTGSSLEFIEHVKLDLFPDEVYVFTPKGTILALPLGATPIDFAYAVHTELGDTCAACKIDRRLAPLSARLESGQTVEIIATPYAKPNPAWLSFAMTGKARTNIRHWLKMQKQNESIELGKRLIQQSLPQTPLAQITETQKQTTATLLGVESFDALCKEVGLGRRLATLVAQHLTQTEIPISSQSLAIQGTEGLAITYATCCYPIPGDSIIGYLEEGHGLVIHQESCQAIEWQKAQAQSVHVCWENDLNKEFSVEVQIDVINRRGVLATMAGIIAEGQSNIIDVRIDERDNQHNSVTFLLSVQNRAHLARLMRRLKGLPEVTRIIRII